MHKLVEWAKDHPYELGALVLVGGVAAYFILLRGGGSAPATGAAANPAEAYYQAQTQLNALSMQYGAQEQVATLQANVQNNQTQAQLQATLAQTNAAVTVAAQQADLQKHAIDTYETLQTHQQSDKYDLSKSALAYVTKINGSQNRLSLLQSILDQPIAAIATQQSEAAQNQPFSVFGTVFGPGQSGAQNAKTVAELAAMFAGV